MQIIKRKSDNAVARIFDDEPVLRFVGDFIGFGPRTFAGFPPTDYVVEANVPAPFFDFVPFQLAYDNGWYVIDQVAYDTAADNIDSISKKRVRRFVQRNPQIRQLLTVKPNQIEAFINTNVTDLASAKGILVTLAQTVAVLGQELFDE